MQLEEAHDLTTQLLRSEDSPELILSKALDLIKGRLTELGATLDISPEELQQDTAAAAELFQHAVAESPIPDKVNAYWFGIEPISMDDYGINFGGSPVYGFDEEDDPSEGEWATLLIWDIQADFQPEAFKKIQDAFPDRMTDYDPAFGLLMTTYTAMIARNVITQFPGDGLLASVPDIAVAAGFNDGGCYLIGSRTPDGFVPGRTKIDAEPSTDMLDADDFDDFDD